MFWRSLKFQVICLNNQDSDLRLEGIWTQGMYLFLMVYTSCIFDSEKREEIAKIKDDLRQKGCEVPPDKADSEHFDSNCITPVSKPYR